VIIALINPTLSPMNSVSSLLSGNVEFIRVDKSTMSPDFANSDSKLAVSSELRASAVFEFIGRGVAGG
jgi:hypothetical protein